ncbi:transposase [Haliea sp.]
MRGDYQEGGDLFSYVSLEQRIPKGHPIRKMRKLVDEALTNLDSVFDEIYADCGRPSIPPERLIRASLLQVFYSIRSERQLMGQLDYNLMFRWFVGLSVDDFVWNPSTFSKNRDRLAQAGIGRRLFEEIVEMENRSGLLVNADLTLATATAERDAAIDMATVLKDGATLEADKGYDTRKFVDVLKFLDVTPHVAQNLRYPDGSAIDDRTTRHASYEIGQRVRKRVEEPFGGLRQTKFRGLTRVRQDFLRVMAAYSLVRIRNLLPEAA